MIYLIDDKKKRQHDFGWSENKFSQYSHILKPLYNIDDIRGIDEDLYSEKNIIIYHESFLDFTSDKYKAVKQREKLKEKAAETNELSLAFFSGSIGSRSLDGNIATLPVSTLYQNLEVLVTHHIQGSVELKYLLFGENPEIEKDLDKLLTEANKGIDIKPAIIPGKNLFIKPNLRNIQNAIEDAEEIPIYPDVSDEKITAKLDEWLNITEYDNIFLPLCFGKVLSDYNGLRLATHIRCTPTKNQLKRIFIYGFVGLDYLIENEYFNILKTKNIHLVAYSKKDFEKAANINFETFKPEELFKEIKKLKLDPPLNYADSHSIANEWAIHQWAKTIGCNENEELTRVFKNVEYNLYFKYLRTIYPIFNEDIISSSNLKIDFKGNPKVLLIDDESEKGWYEIFAFLLGVLNNICTDYLGIDFKNLSSDEVIEKSIDYIFAEKIDVVILDFRLIPSDFENKNPEEITSIKLLRKIKYRNPGIQVIFFTASDKVMNLLELQAKGADGFILKEAPELSIIRSYTKESLSSLCKQLTYCLSNAYLKELWMLFDEIKGVFSKNPLTTKYFPKLLKEQLNGIKYQNLLLQELDSIFEILKTNNENRYGMAMIMLYKLLEYLNEIFYKKESWDKPPVFYDNVQVDYFDKKSKTWKSPAARLDYYNKEKRTTEKIKIKPERLKSTSNKILNLAVKKLNITDDNILMDLIDLSDYRNDFIHSDSSKRGKLKVLESNEILKWSISVTSLIKQL